MKSRSKFQIFASYFAGGFLSVGLITAVNASLLKTKSPATIERACAQTLRVLARDTVRIESMPGSSEMKFRALNALAAKLWNLDGEVSILAGVHPDKKVRDVAEACSQKLSADQTARQQRPKLYAQIKSLHARDAIEEKLKKEWLDSFEDSGVHLPEAQRARVKKIADELTALGLEYDRRIREDKSTMSFSADELKGLPQEFVKGLKQSADGKFVVGFSYPESDPILSSMDNGEARARYSIALHGRGGERNIEVLKETIKLRRELVSLLGHANYSTYVVRRRMAQTPQAVEKFLNDVKAALTEPLRREVAELIAEKAQHVGQPMESVKFLRSDRNFYQDRIRKARFSIDQEGLRKYFPTEAALQWTFDISANLYGIRFQEDRSAKFWHNDARFFQVFDTEAKKLLGHLHIDLFPREGKYNHAAVWPVAQSSTLLKQLPRSVLVTNFNRNGLTLEELETLVHEFGHALHNILAQTRYIEQGGTNVERDFVEAPSQMFEEWARRKESLQRLTKFCNGCPAIDDDMLKRLQRSRAYGQAVRYAGQHQLASYDLVLNVRPDADPMALWIELENSQPWGYNGNQFPRQFGHLIGYASAYYGYMWSEVMALDMLSAFGSNLMDTTTGARYREKILARGGEVPAAQMVREFLGREPNTDAFFKEITGQRLQ
jgi:thimet oligopeptidase